MKKITIVLTVFVLLFLLLFCLFFLQPYLHRDLSPTIKPDIYDQQLYNEMQQVFRSNRSAYSHVIELKDIPMLSTAQTFAVSDPDFKDLVCYYWRSNIRVYVIYAFPRSSLNLDAFVWAQYNLNKKPLTIKDFRSISIGMTLSQVKTIDPSILLLQSENKRFGESEFILDDGSICFLFYYKIGKDFRVVWKQKKYGVCFFDELLENNVLEY